MSANTSTTNTTNATNANATNTTNTTTEAKGSAGSGTAVPKGLRYVKAEPEYGPNGVRKCPMRWGDLAEMLDDEPEEDLNDPRVDYDIRVSHGIDEKGARRTRKVQLVKTRQVEKLIPRSVWERRQRMKPFGAADPRRCTPEENLSVTQEADEVSITPISKSKLKEQEEEERKAEEAQEESRITGTNNRIQCRNCGEHGHWTRDCHKPPAEPSGEIRDDADIGPNRNRSTGYVPPSRRGAGGAGGVGGAGGAGGQPQEDPGKIRLSNLPESATEADIADLVERFGPVRNIYLVRDRNTGDSRGFAFVTFYDAQTAERAIQRLNGHGFHHMILHVEKAKARRRA